MSPRRGRRLGGDVLELEFRGELPHLPRRTVGEVATCAGWVYEGQQHEWHIFAIPLDMLLLKQPKIYIKEEAPYKYVGRGVVPAGELEFRITVEKRGSRFMWVFRGVQRGLINALGRQFFEKIAQNMLSKIINCLQ